MARKNRLVSFAAPLFTAVAVSGTSIASTPTDVPDRLRSEAATGASRDLLVRVDVVLNSITYTTYSKAGIWIPARGVYEVVCARFLTNVLYEATPVRLAPILAYAGNRFPVLSMWDYYPFFRAIAPGDASEGWLRIARVDELRPGDVIAWKYTDASTSEAWGHIVVVVSSPTVDARWAGAYRLRVADSSSSRHSYDSRARGETGVGAGEMLLRTSSNGDAQNLAWTLKGYWRSDLAGIVMVRPLD